MSTNRTRTVFVIGIMLLWAIVSGMPHAIPVKAQGISIKLLLVTSANSPNHLGPYLGEILRAEGLFFFDSIDLAALNATDLTQYSAVILAETPLTASQATKLTTYVTNGGKLIAMRPDPQIAGLFGIADEVGIQNIGYLKINTSNPSGAGLISTTLQIHGTSSLYTLNGATTVATLYSGLGTATTYPAVITAASGSGRTAAFAYDLASSVALTRQGNPANADTDVDGDGVFRTIDLFQSAVPGGSPWVNRSRIKYPQADEQQRLFANIIYDLVGMPLPRIWYFPDRAYTMLIATGDAHANPSAYYQSQIDSISAHNGRMTYYITQGADPSDAEVLGWQALDNTFGIHPYAYKPDLYPPYNITNLTQGYQVYDDWYAQRFSTPKSRTVRNHQVAWLGWTDAAELAVSHGLALDANFYHWGAWIQQSDGTWPLGYITGSGQAMRFIKADGTILPYYQQLTQLVDEHLLAAVSESGYQGLNAADAILASTTLIDQSLATDYAAIMTQFHVDYYGLGDPQLWAEGVLDYAHSRGVPIWNADQWLDFIETRANSKLQGVMWDSTSSKLTFSTALNPLPANVTNAKLTLMVPASTGGVALGDISVDSQSTPFTLKTFKGDKYAFFTVTPGAHTVAAFYGVVPATNTPTNTQTHTPTRTPTNTPVPPTNTPVPPTNTPVPPTNTPISPTGTPKRHDINLPLVRSR